MIPLVGTGVLRDLKIGVGPGGTLTHLVGLGGVVASMKTRYRVFAGSGSERKLKCGDLQRAETSRVQVTRENSGVNRLLRKNPNYDKC